MERNINGKILSTQKFARLYPFRPKHIKTRGHDLYYLDEGSGSPVLMVHGNPTWSFYYRHLVNVLSPNHRTIVPDHIGCGFSDKPDAGDYKYTLQSRVEDLDSLITHLDLNEKITIVVHDWGGMIGLAWALDHLDRIERIVITNTSGFFLPQDKKISIKVVAFEISCSLCGSCGSGRQYFFPGSVVHGPSFSFVKTGKKGIDGPL